MRVSRERTVVALLSESSEAWEEAEAAEDEVDEACRKVAMSGALYESMFVVERSSIGEEILALLTCCAGNLAVVARLGIGGGASISERLAARLVKARASDMAR